MCAMAFAVSVVGSGVCYVFGYVSRGASVWCIDSVIKATPQRFISYYIVFDVRGRAGSAGHQYLL